MDSSCSVEDLLGRAKGLLSELGEFKRHIRDLRQDRSVEMSHFLGTVRSEVNMLERLSQQPSGESRDHVARSSNLPFLEAVWVNCKGLPSIVALQKRIFYGRQVVLDSKKTKSGERFRKEGAVIVDTISHGGRVWSKVSLLTNSRLLFDLAKQGWEMEGSDGDESEDANIPENEDDDDIPLLKTVKELCKASSCHRIRTKQPEVRLLLPRIFEGETAETDRVLAACRALGAKVICGPNSRSVPSMTEAAPYMAPNPTSTFSPILNIDCTVLLALVSEFSHAKVSKEPWFHTALQRQVEIEGNENLLPSLLYPTLGDRKMTCTEEAAVRMREIVNTIGTPSEKARTAILFGEDECEGEDKDDLLDRMRQWSAHEVPRSWQLPIRIVPENEADCLSDLPPQASIVSKQMTNINKSVFLHGWARGHTTITSNRTVVKQIENELEKFEDLEDSVWPSIWLCPTARSLVGKESRGDKNHKLSERKIANGAMRLPDPLHRERERRNGLDFLELQEGRHVEDRRPNGYPCDEVIEAKISSQR